jgi:hypothetical protein
MATAKEKMTEIIQNQPDDSSYDEILKELAFARMVERGSEDSKAGRTISNEEMGRRIRSQRPVSTPTIHPESIAS